jgi:hypothetical protein
VLGLDGKPQYFIGVQVDVTLRRDSDEVLASESQAAGKAVVAGITSVQVRRAAEALRPHALTSRDCRCRLIRGRAFAAPLSRPSPIAREIRCGQPSRLRASAAGAPSTFWISRPCVQSGGAMWATSTWFV